MSDARRIIEGETPKRFMQQAAPRYGEGDIIHVNSSHGTIDIFPNGQVVSFTANDPKDEDAKNLARIVRFDVEEWKQHWNQDLPKGWMDILDLGYWLDNGKYEPPVQDWRDNFRDQMDDIEPD